MHLDDQLFREGPAAGAKAPILIAHLDGALDAGSAGTLAVLQLLRNLGAQRVATFDSDYLIDYRSHRPIMQVEDWVTTDMNDPEIAVDLIHDDQGLPVLVLHGPEPDARWNQFTAAIQKIARDAGVEAVFSFHGLPAAVPHTRPATVHVQSTDEELVPEQPEMGGLARFPAPYTSFLQHRLSAQGLTGVTLLATVPYYMAGSTFPRASSALLRRLSEMTGLSLPVGDLERGADEDATQVEHLLEQNNELRGTVTALEQHYDSISGAAAEGAEVDDSNSESNGPDASVGPIPDWERIFGVDGLDEGFADDSFPEAELLGEGGDDSLADAIGDAIENYLKTQTKQKRRRDRNGIPGSTLNGDDEDSEGRPTPRHRAPRPWEIAESSESPQSGNSVAGFDAPED